MKKLIHLLRILVPEIYLQDFEVSSIQKLQHEWITEKGSKVHYQNHPNIRYIF